MVTHAYACGRPPAREKRWDSGCLSTCTAEGTCYIDKSLPEHPETGGRVAVTKIFPPQSGASIRWICCVRPRSEFFSHVHSVLCGTYGWGSGGWAQGTARHGDASASGPLRQGRNCRSWMMLSKHLPVLHLLVLPSLHDDSLSARPLDSVSRAKRLWPKWLIDFHTCGESIEQWIITLKNDTLNGGQTEEIEEEVRL